jgi:hypothetical protein
MVHSNADRFVTRLIDDPAFREQILSAWRKHGRPLLQSALLKDAPPPEDLISVYQTHPEIVSVLQGLAS